MTSVETHLGRAGTSHSFLPVNGSRLVTSSQPQNTICCFCRLDHHRRGVVRQLGSFAAKFRDRFLSKPQITPPILVSALTTTISPNTIGEPP